MMLLNSKPSVPIDKLTQWKTGVTIMWALSAFLLSFLLWSCSSEIDTTTMVTTEQAKPVDDQVKHKHEAKPIEKVEDKESRTISEPVMVGGTFMVECQVLEPDSYGSGAIGCNGVETVLNHTDNNSGYLSNQNSTVLVHPLSTVISDWDIVYQIDPDTLEDLDSLDEIIAGSDSLQLIKPSLD